jgi:hypothetical protein
MPMVTLYTNNRCLCKASFDILYMEGVQANPRVLDFMVYTYSKVVRRCLFCDPDSESEGGGRWVYLRRPG